MPIRSTDASTDVAAPDTSNAAATLDPGADQPVAPGWLPPSTGGHKPRWPKVVTVIAALLAATMVAGTLAVTSTLAELGRVEVATLTPWATGATNWLMVGSDSRANLSEQDKVRLTAGDADGDRTDTMFVMSVRGDRVAVLALPRDLWVTRCDASSGRINSAFPLGGADCLVDTVEQATGLPIHHLATVDFLGFVDLVDAVGGVELCLEYAIVDPWSGANLPAGCQVLDGRAALSYVRVRKIDSDLHRIGRQQQFLAALAARVKQTASPWNPLGLLATARAGAGALSVDQTTGLGELLGLLRAARGIADGGLSSHTVPVTDASIGGAAVLLPIDGEAEALYAMFRDGSIFDIAPATEGDTPAA